MSPVPGPEQPYISPVRRDPDLGIVGPYIGSTTDKVQVFRSWGLLDNGKYYGENFTWSEVQKRGNWVHAIYSWITLNLMFIFLVATPLT